MHRNCLERHGDLTLESLWFIFNNNVEILIFMHLGSSLGKKTYRQTNLLERENLRKRQGRGLVTKL